MRDHFRRRGFTLIELLIVILIMGMLAGVVIASSPGAVLEQAPSQQDQHRHGAAGAEE